MFDGDVSECSEMASESTCKRRKAEKTVAPTKKGKTMSIAFVKVPLLQMRMAMEKEMLSVDNLDHVTQILTDFKLKVGPQFHISVWVILIALWHPDHFATLMNPKKWTITNLARDEQLEECNMEDIPMRERIKAMLLVARQFMSTCLEELSIEFVTSIFEGMIDTSATLLSPVDLTELMKLLKNYKICCDSSLQSSQSSSLPMATMSIASTSADSQTRLVGVYGCNDPSSIANMDDDAFEDAFGRYASRRRTGKASCDIFLQTAGNPNKLTASVPMEDYVMDAILYKKSDLEGLRDTKEMWKYASMKCRTTFPENSVHLQNIKTAMRTTLSLMKNSDTMREVPVLNQYASIQRR
ncbi:uncharacterized protein LOC132933869 [Metopolophium dirhodum]|uniref:uncharacterized protein LOC132933869 n=1 Tax=Metopolophium dirhodum TaxID=44670 RepID=UPI00298FB831|nr:uncharacterized protein LOC132933869 [Metopolophium dirhodum]